MEKRLIDEVSGDSHPHFEPFGWHHWPDHPWMAYQFRRQLGETQEGGGSISECFRAASRMIPGDKESWHTEWLQVADRNHARGDAAERAGHIQTAKNCWLRAVDYYRSAEFWLPGEDSRRLATFDKLEACSEKWGRYLTPPLEVVKIPYENGAHLHAYFIRAPFHVEKQPVLISFGGLDSFKDEMYFMTGRAALQRGIAMLMVDGPGQGATIRRDKIYTRHDFEVPVGRCIDYLETRGDVDTSRIAASGSSLGGYYVARAGCYEHRLAAVISHGAIWAVNELFEGAGEDHGLAGHIKWGFGCASMEKAMEKARDFTLEGHLQHMECPYLIVHGGYDVLGVRAATKVFENAKAVGVDVTIQFIDEESTGADHCQHDNPTIGQEHMADWLVDRFGIDEKEQLGRVMRPIL
ncbi:MAG: alpha/beta hydrolase [SAR324 cluster bacterium]|nr:alpha/beta hydrolase [SAR324 cluster bacterium]